MCLHSMIRSSTKKNHVLIKRWYVQVITNSLLLLQFSSVFSVILQQSITAATKTVKALCPEAHSTKEKNLSPHFT